MDDGDLGNFFAKKDKIKKKKKGTKVTSATLIEQLKSDTNINEEQQSQQQSLSEAKVARPVSYQNYIFSIYTLYYDFLFFIGVCTLWKDEILALLQYDSMILLLACLNISFKTNNKLLYFFAKEDNS